MLLKLSSAAAAMKQIQIYSAEWLFPFPLGDWEWRIQFRGTDLLNAYQIWASLPQGERWWDQHDVDDPIAPPIDDDDDDDDEADVVDYNDLFDESD